MKNNLLVTIIIVIVVAAAGFFGGMQYQKMQQPNATQFNGQGQFGRRFGQNGNGSVVRGQITSDDANSITVQMRDGSSKIINITNSTNITKAVSGSKDDVKTGEQIMVFGSNNSDGSITAQTIQLNPMFRGGNGTQRQ